MTTLDPPTDGPFPEPTVSEFPRNETTLGITHKIHRITTMSVTAWMQPCQLNSGRPNESQIAMEMGESG